MNLIQSLRLWTDRDGETTPLGEAAAAELERLAADRNAIIEQCARVAEPMKFSTAEEIADAIRALKDKP